MYITQYFDVSISHIIASSLLCDFNGCIISHQKTDRSLMGSKCGFCPRGADSLAGKSVLGTDFRLQPFRCPCVWSPARRISIPWEPSPGSVLEMQTPGPCARPVAIRSSRGRLELCVPTDIPVILRWRSLRTFALFPQGNLRPICVFGFTGLGGEVFSCI